MDRKRKKRLRITFIILASLIVGGFAVNWYLTYKLESSLRQKFREEVSKATEGFYNFSYDKLSVGFFSGELSITGVELVPDSAVFLKWKNGDSLPDLYYKIHIEKIHFKGINLTWRRNYKNLDFKLFELKTPDIKVYSPQMHSSLKSPLDKQPAKESKTLYQMISTYIDILTVKEINLYDASIFYTVEDSISPSIYALTDAKFNAYGFRLDKDSYSSGKLLYCDNFEFSADKPQQLLHSPQLILNTANIKLSTINERIQIDGVHLHPSEEFWESRTEKAGGYLDASIKSVLVGGVKFTRENALNYLDADSFSISSTDIRYFSVKDKDDNRQKDTIQANNATGGEAWSLYSIISPILQRISIGEIGIEKTKFNYTFTQDGRSDIYSLGRFSFQAKNFLIDPQSEKQKRFWYAENFAMSASDIKGLMASNNSNISIAELSLDTENKEFKISDIKISPISTYRASKDYYSGKIKSIQIDGLNYDTGVSAGQLKIESPDIQYFKVRSKSPKTESKSIADITDNADDALGIFNPYADYLSVKSITLSDANFILHDLGTKSTFRIRHLNFYALKFLIDDETRRTSRYLFTCEDIGLSFKNFDNLLPGKDYRLQIRNTNISTLTGLLLMEDVKLIPQKDTWDKAPATYYDISIPLIKVKGFDNNAYIEKNYAKIESLEITSPQLKMVKTQHPPDKTDAGSNTDKSFSLFDKLSSKSIKMDGINFSYTDETTNSSLQTSLQALHLSNLSWEVNRAFSIDEFVLQSPKVDYISSNSEKSAPSDSNPKEVNKLLKILGNKVNIGKFTVSNGELGIKEPQTGFAVQLEHFGLSGINWNTLTGKSFLEMASVDIIKPAFSIDEYRKTDSLSPAKKDSSKTDFYSSLQPYINKLSIGRFNLADAHLDYNYSTNKGQQDNHKLNTTNLFIDKLLVNTDERKTDIKDIRFDTKDLSFPIMNGYYTIDIGKIDMSKKDGRLELSGLKMTSVYPKMDFAYQHPAHMDWFDVSMGNLALTGVDYETYFTDNVLKAKRLIVKDVMLENMKNKKIYTPPKLQPLIYTKLYNIPFGLTVDSTHVSNFSVIYEELPKNGDNPGQISFMNMNATIAGLGNIASHPQQFMHMEANGLLMGTGYFTAKWDMPVSPDYDCFILDARIHGFDLRDLNRLITPLAKAEVKTGILKDLTFRTEASGTDATVDMKFLYNDLGITVLKGDDRESTNKFMTNVANAIIRSNNPNKRNSKPREPYLRIERDPYHSTFNYFWQILQPAVVESVGVSQGKQNFMKKAAGFFSKVKNFFTGKKEPKKPENNQIQEKN